MKVASTISLVRRGLTVDVGCHANAKWSVIRSLFAFAWLIALSALLAHRLDAQPPRSGTYRFLICSTSCAARDSARAQIVGKLVIQDSSFSVSELPDDVRRLFKVRRTFALRSDGSRGDDANACLVWAETRWREGPYAGVAFTALTHWSAVAPDTIRVVMFQIPEGADVATLQYVGGQLRGTIRSVGSAAEDVAPSYMVAWWVGPATLEPCFDVVRKQPIR